MKVRFKERFQDQLQGRLHHAILHRCDAQGSGPAFRLGNLDHSDRGDLVAVRAQSGLQLLDPRLFLPCLAYLLDRLPITSGRAGVGFDLAPGFPQYVRPPAFVVPAVKPPLLLLRGFTVEGSLSEVWTLLLKGRVVTRKDS